jgi:ABC-2 type transport system ATP-binding protein
VIRTEGLTKAFGDLVALDHLDLEVVEGEVFGWLGPNGAGKTTTVRLLLDFIRPTSGTASVLGGSGADLDVRRRIGYLPGDLRLDPAYTGQEVFDFYGALRGGYDRAWLESLLGRFHLDPARPLGELSTGNRRKVGIVQAFMHRPELLILDEPTSGLDPLLQHEFNRLVREVVAEGATVFLSSHVLPEVDALADRVGILRAGQLVTVVDVEDLRQRARQRLVLRVRGTPRTDLFASIPEVVEASVHHDEISLVIEGNADRVIKAAAQLEVIHIRAPETDIEDAFLTYYGATS